MFHGRNPQNEIVRIDADTGDVFDRSGNRIGTYIHSSELDTAYGNYARGLIHVSYGESVMVPLSNQPLPDANGNLVRRFQDEEEFVAVSGPSWWSAAGIFAAGWLGGYLAWVGIGKYQEMRVRGTVFQKMNRKVPYVPPPEKKNWQR